MLALKVGEVVSEGEDVGAVVAGLVVGVGSSKTFVFTTRVFACTDRSNVDRRPFLGPCTLFRWRRW